MCWTQNGTILMAKGCYLYKTDPDKDNQWIPLVNLRNEGIKNISRIALSPDNKHIAITGEQVETNPEAVVQEQLEAYNNRDALSFIATYADDVTLSNFPNDELYTGIKHMHTQYESFFYSTPDLHCEIKKRIVIGNKVIDEEYVTANGNHISAVAIYEVENGLIKKVTFIR